MKHHHFNQSLLLTDQTDIDGSNGLDEGPKDNVEQPSSDQTS